MSIGNTGRIAALLTLGALAAPGCVVHDTSGGPPPTTGGGVTVETNAPPVITWANAGCYWDSYYRDDIWYFEADVDDPNSPYDVVAVYADVYDARSGAWVDSFELYPTSDPYYWFSDWLGSSTYLACGYPDYVVDVWAYDSYDAEDALSVYPVIE